MAIPKYPTGGLANNGAIPKQNSSSLYGGVGSTVSIGGKNTQNNPNALTPGQFGGQTQPAIGTHPGLINPSPATPVKKVTSTTPSGHVMTVEYHPESKNGNSSSSSSTPKSTSTTKLTPEQIQANTNLNNQQNYGLLSQPPVVGSTKDNAQGLLNTGQTTPLEQDSRTAVTRAGQMTPQEEQANTEVARANELQKEYSNVGTLSPYAEASMYTDRARSPEEIQALQQAPDLAGRASATNGLTNSLSNIYGSSRVAGANAALQGIQTAAGRGLSAASTNLGAAQTQASRAQSGAGTVFGASLNTPTTPGQASFSGLNGYQGGTTSGTGADINQFGDPNDPATASKYKAYMDYNDKYNAGLGEINQATANEPGIINTLTQFGLNNQPISAIQNLNELFSGQTSQPGQITLKH